MFCCYWVLLLYLLEDLPYPEDLGGLGSFFDEASPIDCATPSSSRLSYPPPSSLLSSDFACHSDVFCVSSPSVNQGCGVGRFFRIPTPDSDSSIFENPTPTPAVLKNRLRLQLKTCDSTDSDSTTLAVTAVVAASYL